MKTKVLIFTLLVTASVLTALFLLVDRNKNMSNENKITDQSKEITLEDDRSDHISFIEDDYTKGYEEDYQRQINEGLLDNEQDKPVFSNDDDDDEPEFKKEIIPISSVIEEENSKINKDGKIEEIEQKFSLSDDNNTTEIIWD